MYTHDTAGGDSTHVYTLMAVLVEMGHVIDTTDGNGTHAHTHGITGRDGKHVYPWHYR